MRLILGFIIALGAIVALGAILIGELCGWREEGE